MMDAVIDGMIRFLSAEPDALLPSTRLGDRLPGSVGDLPTVAMSLAVESVRGTGLRSFRREGHQLVQNTAAVDIVVSPDTFSSDLKTLQISPLPLKRNPASLNGDFSQDDVQVVRVTGPAQPLLYKFTNAPTTAEEYRIDSLRSILIFGAPQPGGEKLQVTHWTMNFREDIRAFFYRGAITLEVWGRNSDETATLARKVQGKLGSDAAALRQNGFASVFPAALFAAENASYQPAAGSAFAVWKQKVVYKFCFDAEQAPEADAGGPIRKINVHVDRTLDEVFSTPAGT
jgi:hypothetical protein